MTAKMMTAAVGLTGGKAGSRTHQLLQLAPEADPGYHLARLSELVVCPG
ncbi:hypothetical protein [Arthrobacter sp.]